MGEQTSIDSRKKRKVEGREKAKLKKGNEIKQTPETAALDAVLAARLRQGSNLTGERQRNWE